LIIAFPESVTAYIKLGFLLWTLFIFSYILFPHPTTLLSVTRHYSNSSYSGSFFFFYQEEFRTVTELCHLIFHPFYIHLSMWWRARLLR